VECPAFVNWTLTAFLLSSIATTAICGRLGDLYGRRKVMTVAYVPRSQPVSDRSVNVDWPGGILLIAGIGSILTAFSMFSRYAGANIPMVLFVSGAASLAIWCWHELRQQSPLIQVRLLKERDILFANLAIFLIAMGPMTFPIVLFPLLQQPASSGVGFGLAAAMAGLIKLPRSGINLLAAVAGGIGHACRCSTGTAQCRRSPGGRLRSPDRLAPLPAADRGHHARCAGSRRDLDRRVGSPDRCPGRAHMPSDLAYTFDFIALCLLSLLGLAALFGTSHACSDCQ
jgi:MFS family permease